MTISEERMRILQMIQEGMITAEDGIRLLDSIEQSEKQGVSSESDTESNRTARFFRVVVTDTQTEKIRVNVRLPISVINAGFKMGARFAPEVQGLNSADMMEHIRSGVVGKIIDVYDDKDGEHVEVFLE